MGLCLVANLKQTDHIAQINS